MACGQLTGTDKRGLAKCWTAGLAMAETESTKNPGARTCGCWTLTTVAFVVLLLVTFGWFFLHFASLTIHVAFAEDQTETFEEMRSQAVRAADPLNITSYLEYAVNYYPSGTKQVKGSPLDKVVERARRSAVREIIAHLRSKTGQDLGDDPQAWIARFGAHE
jgi:hypothetical protein